MFLWISSSISLTGENYIWQTLYTNSGGSSFFFFIRMWSLAIPMSKARSSKTASLWRVHVVWENYFFSHKTWWPERIFFFFSQWSNQAIFLNNFFYLLLNVSCVLLTVTWYFFMFHVSFYWTWSYIYFCIQYNFRGSVIIELKNWIN